MKNRFRFFFPIITILALLLILLIVNLEGQVESLNDNILLSKNYGGNGDEIIRDVAIDSNNNFIITGWTSSDEFNSKFGNQNKGEEDGFVAKLDDNGNYIWLNFLQGSLTDSGASVVIDSNDNIIVAGNTKSNDFTPKGTVDRGGMSFENGTQGPTHDIFITKYDSSGQLIWSRFSGGGGNDLVTSIVLDSQENLIISGFTTSSSSLVNSNSALYAGAFDGFILKFDTKTGYPIWGEYIGGSGDDIAYSVAINSEDNIYVSGYTNSSDFPLINSSTTPSGNRDIFIAHFDSEGTQLWRDIIGINSAGSAKFEFEEKMGLQVDNDDNIILGSWSKTRNFQEDKIFRNGDKNTFIMKMRPDRLNVQITELRGNAEDRITDLFIDENNNIYVTGITFSFNFQTKYPIFASYRDFGDAFIYVLDQNFKPVWSTYYGGSFLDFGSTILLDKDKSIIIAGTTSSFDFPLGSGSNSIFPFLNQGSNQVSGYSDAFLSRITIEADESKFEYLPSSLQVILENISIFEWAMMLAAIVFSYRSIQYYRRTNIFEFLLFTGLFLILAANSFIQLIWYFLSSFDLGEELNLLRQPIFGLSFVWILLFIHSYRLKWLDPPVSIKNTGIFLFLLKITLPLLFNLLSLDSLFLASVATVSFVAFDIYVMVILLYSYFSIELINPNERIKRAYRLWKVTWIIFFIGFILLVTMTTIQIWIIIRGFEDVNLELIILFRTLSSFFNSGIYFFIVFLIIGYIAIQYPEGMLLSHAQMVKAIELYTVAQTKNPARMQTKMDDLFLYIKETQEILGRDELPDKGD